jgi:putative lipoic acid-binding regulatory protein
VDLLESTHAFPGTYTIKAIGSADDDFADRVVAAVSEHLPAASDLDYSIRAAKGGRHVAVTLQLTVQNAEQIRAVYTALQGVSGLTLLL